jgi:alginate O-acetyltransferase complex protein AlgJ
MEAMRCLLLFAFATSVLAGADPAADFREWCTKQATAGESMTVAGSDGWLFLRSELRHISVGPFWGEAAAKVSKASSPDKADPLPAIVDFNAQLKALGIELILAPVPCKALIYPEKLGGSAEGRMDTVHQEFYAQLAAKGVKVLDLADAFAKEKAKAAAPVLYCKTDTHWSPYACELAAKRIKERLGAPAWLPAKPGAFTTAAEKRTIVGDLTDGKGSEELPVRVVESAAGSPMEDKASPVVLMGDSHCLVFHAGADLHGTGAGLADQLAAELGMAVDVIGVRGSGATPARVNLLRRARSDPAYLAGKKLIIWCFAAREFTESSGWSLVPFSSVAKPAGTALPAQIKEP